MEYILYLSIVVVLIVIIKRIGKSARINQLKNIDESKIKSIGEYEKNSKTNKPSIFPTKLKLDNPWI